ncbi:hypothetical protein PR202_gb00573 [Eleusine coracana subsp. coracana]|uniref:Reverse transcriptase zinc-binding domain-containing protein n=1 Tax=Eleusine coracana subsp. coracana TaxID=191504 RepID=A0AAV5DUF0_ELECO|nr:hypothetical protein PR202_gb00573 [Eleusine coracana subsp. coracana]
MQNKQWISDITGQLTIMALLQYLELWQLIQEARLQPGVPDDIYWRWTASRQYTAKSAYQMLFAGSTALQGAKLLWKTWSPPKVKFFLYLALHNRTWTAERWFRHGLQESDVCTLCDQAPERVEHLLVHCPYAKEVWWEILTHINMPQRFQQLNGDLYTTWSNLRAGLAKMPRKGLDTLFMLVTCTIWNERNSRVFRSESTTPQLTAQRVKEEARLWVVAGAKSLGCLLLRE